MPQRRGKPLGNALVALLYLVLVLWVHRSILETPGVVVPMPAAMIGLPTGTLYQGDQRFVIGTIATNVQKLLRGPRALAASASAIRCAPRTPSASTCSARACSRCPSTSRPANPS